MRFGGGGGRLRGGVGEPTGDAAAGGRVPLVTEVSQAGAARVSCAIAWRRGEERRGEERRAEERRVGKERRSGWSPYR